MEQLFEEAATMSRCGICVEGQWGIRWEYL